MLTIEKYDFKYCESSQSKRRSWCVTNSCNWKEGLYFCWMLTIEKNDSKCSESSQLKKSDFMRYECSQSKRMTPSIMIAHDQKECIHVLRMFTIGKNYFRYYDCSQSKRMTPSLVKAHNWKEWLQVAWMLAIERYDLMHYAMKCTLSQMAHWDIQNYKCKHDPGVAAHTVQPRHSHWHQEGMDSLMCRGKRKEFNAHLWPWLTIHFLASCASSSVLTDIVPSIDGAPSSKILVCNPAQRLLTSLTEFI